MVLLSQSVGPDGNEQENVSKLGPEARVDPVAAALLLSGAAGRLSDGECSGAPAAPAGQEIICCCWKPPDEADINYEPIISVLFVLLKTTSWGKSVGPLRRKLNAELELSLVFYHFLMSLSHNLDKTSDLKTSRSLSILLGSTVDVFWFQLKLFGSLRDETQEAISNSQKFHRRQNIRHINCWTSSAANNDCSLCLF